MKHVSEGMLQAYLDGELPSVQHVLVRQHVTGCATCEQELGSLREMAIQFSAAMERLDTISDPVALRASRLRIIGQAARVHCPIGPGIELVRDAPGLAGVDCPAQPAPAMPRPSAKRAWLRAAVLVLASAGALSATIPGSPLRVWSGQLWERVKVSPGSAELAGPVATSQEGFAVDSALIAVAPASGQIQILLNGPIRESQIRVRLVDTGNVEVEVIGMAQAVRHRSAPGRIEITGGGGPGEVEIRLPRSLHAATIEVGGQVYLRKTGDDLILLVPAEQRAGAEIVFKPNP
jgi:hypothetical protein